MNPRLYFHANMTVIIVLIRPTYAKILFVKYTEEEKSRHYENLSLEIIRTL